MSERLFKVLGDGMEPVHGGKGRWLAGRWMPPVANIKLCERGWHLCREQDLVLWLGPHIYEAKWRGERIDGDDKIVVSEARTVRRLKTWNERTQRLFAADCAESVIGNIPEAKRGPFVEAIRVARLFANGGASGGELSAAYSAAGSAAWSAAGSAASAALGSAVWAADSAAYSAARSAAWWAARSAAWWAADSAAYSAAWRAADSAARAAARAAAWSAERAAERAAAGSAAWRAAWSAERQKQTSMLMGYLYPKEADHE